MREGSREEPLMAMEEKYLGSEASAAAQPDLEVAICLQSKSASGFAQGISNPAEINNIPLKK